MKRTVLLWILASASFGCATGRLEEPPWPAPTPLARPAEVAGARQATSLWAEGAPLTAVYDDRRACRVGDLVTVVVVESSEASRQAATDVSRDASVNAGVSNFLGWTPDSPPFNHLYGSTGFDPSVKAKTANSFKGQGSTSRKDTLRTRVTARVVNVLEDGNLVIEGRRQVKVNEEDQFLFVRGIARPMDISPGNTIPSTALAEAQVLYGGNGLITAQQKPGWLYRALDAVWPF